MYKSNNIAATSNAAGKCLAGHISSTATAQTIISTEVLETQVLSVISLEDCMSMVRKY